MNIIKAKIIIIAAFSVLFISIIMITNVNANVQYREIKPYKYASIKIEYGDTLETLACQYNDDIDTNDIEYIAMIKRINNLTGDKLHPGCFLTIAYR